MCHNKECASCTHVKLAIMIDTAAITTVSTTSRFIIHATIVIDFGTITIFAEIAEFGRFAVA